MARREQAWPSLMTGSPFAFMRRFSEEMDRLFEDFGFGRGWLAPTFGRDLFPRGFSESGQNLWSPQVEMFEREGQLVLRADLPGLTKDDVKVEVTNDAISISGERKSEHEEKREGYYHSERSYGSFYRQIPLPEGVNADDANATFRNGVLEITMQAPQRQTERSGRRLEIKEGTEGQQTQSRAQAAGQKR
jgi:HSP20 family protein